MGAPCTRSTRRSIGSPAWRRSRRLGGILLNTQPNFAWLTGGRSNQIDGSRENGSGSLLVSARGERFVVANNIEMPRLQEEALAGLGFTPREYLWTEEQAEPGHADRHGEGARCAARSVATTRCPAGTPMEAEIAASRAPLTPAEVDRYRALGRDLGGVVGDVCRRSVARPQRDRDRPARGRGAWPASARRAIVTLVAADDRMGRFRHPGSDRGASGIAR